MSAELDFLGPIDFDSPIVAQVHRKLRNAIIRTFLQPGRRVSEAEVAAKLEVSRQPVRETFIRLADEGMLEIRPQKGSFVPQVSMTKVLEIQFVREAIEADVVRRAAREFTKHQLDQLDQQVLEQEQNFNNNPATFMELDDLFHMTLAKGVNQSHAWQVIESQKAQLDRVRFLAISEFPSVALGEQHGAIVKAIASRDPDLAEREMREHLRHVLRDLPRIALRNKAHFTD